MSNKRAQNPQAFRVGDVVKSIHTGERWKIASTPQGGVGQMLSLDSGKLQSWNFGGNKHFVLIAPAKTASSIGAQTTLEL